MTPTMTTADSKTKVQNPDSPLELLKTVAVALLIALLLRVFVFQPFNIPSESMRPKLLVGDYVVVSKWDYGLSFASIPFEPRLWQGRIPSGIPERGDVVVFKYPHDLPSNGRDPAVQAGKVDFIKRVIGLPGDRVQVVGGQVILNGTPVPRELIGPHIITDADGNTFSVNRYQETLPNGVSFVTYDYAPDNRYDNTDVYVVPEGSLFMMGDNRDNSTDSRVPPTPLERGVGFVPIENVVGKARTVLLSWDETTRIYLPWTWFTGLRLDRIAVSVQ